MEPTALVSIVLAAAFFIRLAPRPQGLKLLGGALDRVEDEPPEASVAAITAPSTIGALHTTTLPRLSSGSISTAISLFVSAPPRSTRMATPAGDQARSIAAMIPSTDGPQAPLRIAAA